MTQDTVHQEGEPIIVANLGENGGRITFQSLPDASSWIKKEIQLWQHFDINLVSRNVPLDVIPRQLKLPSSISEGLDQAMSLEGAELSQAILELTALFEKYADYDSLYSESPLGIAILKTHTEPNQRAALGGLASIIGIPAHELLGFHALEPHLLADVLSGYALGRELNVVKRSDLSRHQERMDDATDKFKRIVAQANEINQVAREEKNKLLEDMAQEAERQKNSWEELIESSRNEWKKLWDTFNLQLRLEAPATYWANQAKRTFRAAMWALLSFGVIASVFIVLLILQGPSFLAELARVGPKGAMQPSASFPSVPSPLSGYLGTLHDCSLPTSSGAMTRKCARRWRPRFSHLRKRGLPRPKKRSAF